MKKEFVSGRMQVVLNNGTKAGKPFSIPNVVETYQVSQVETVIGAIAKLASVPVGDVKVTEVYRYQAQGKAE